MVYKVPTIKKLRALFDNYVLDASDSEHVTPNELQENDDFINAVLDTRVMKTAMNFLNRKGLNYLSHFLHNWMVFEMFIPT